MVVESAGDIHALPEDCIATVLSLTSPKDACRLSAVASTFRSASQSDAVWDRFLPSDYRDIISRAVDGPDPLLAKFRSKKDLYLHLCDHPILIDGGRKSFSLEKWSGKKCYMLAASDLIIVLGDTRQYWQSTNLHESRFPEVAELLDVCWFEIHSMVNINMLSSSTNYAAYLVFTCKSRGYIFEHQPAEAFVGISGCKSAKHFICLHPEEVWRQWYQILPRGTGLSYNRLAHIQRQQDKKSVEEKIKNSLEEKTKYPRWRNDGWMEVELGECFVKRGQDGDFQVSLVDMNSGNWRSDVVIQGIEIRPKESK